MKNPGQVFDEHASTRLEDAREFTPAFSVEQTVRLLVVCRPLRAAQA